MSDKKQIETNAEEHAINFGSFLLLYKIINVYDFYQEILCIFLLNRNTKTVPNLITATTNERTINQQYQRHDEDESNSGAKKHTHTHEHLSAATLGNARIIS